MKQQRKKEKNIFTETDPRSGKLHTVVSLQWPDGVRFRRRYRNLELARNMLKRIDGAIVTGQWEALRNELTPKKGKPEAPKPEVITFGRLAKEFKSYITGPKSGSDWPKIQCWLVDGMTDFFEADTPIGEITLRKGEEFIAYRQNEDEAKNCTINKDLSVLRGMFGKAKDWTYLSESPIAGLKNLPDDTMVHDRYLKPEEFDRLLNAAMTLPQGDSEMVFMDMPEFIVVDGHTGLRLSELLTMTFPHVNFGERILSVKNKPNRRTKNGSERHIRFNQDTYDALIELRHKAVNKFGTVFQMKDGSGWLPHRSVLQRRFEKCANAAGLYSGDRTQNVTIHTLRHTFGSQLALKGIPLRRIQYLMGHTSISTTERYAHLLKEETYGDTEVLQGLAKVATNWQQAKVAGTAN